MRAIPIWRLLLTAICLLGAAATAQADDEDKCIANLVKARGSYIKCVEGWLAKVNGGAAIDATKLAKCLVKYDGVWTKLQGLGTTCSQPTRFNDNGDGTVSDQLTGLIWEKKSDNGGVHDKDTTRTWSTGAPHYGNGTVFTTFLRDGLNAGGGFTSHNAWRLPTFTELLTILPTTPIPCTTPPCVVAAFDDTCTPGCNGISCSCTPSDASWSNTTAAGNSANAWLVDFETGGVFAAGKTSTGYVVRAVRGGR